MRDGSAIRETVYTLSDCPPFLFTAIVLVIAYKRLYKAPPQGSVLVEASSVVKRLLKGGNWKRAFKGGDVFWDSAKPSVIEATEGTIDRTKIIWYGLSLALPFIIEM